MIEWIRAEMVGPSRILPEKIPDVAEFKDGVFHDLKSDRTGPLVCEEAENIRQEVLYYRSEPPWKRYGIGLLHPDAVLTEEEQASAKSEDRENDVTEDGVDAAAGDDENPSDGDSPAAGDDDFEVTSPDVRRPSTMGISLCVKLEKNGRVVIRLPSARKFAWQEPDDEPFQLNGRYESFRRLWRDNDGAEHKSYVWRRFSSFIPEASWRIPVADLKNGKKITKDLKEFLPAGCPVCLAIEVFPRWRGSENVWLLTIILKNTTKHYSREGILFQTYFEAQVENGAFVRYPESQRPFEQLDEEEKSLAMLYQDCATWGIGHGCAAGWDVDLGQTPSVLYADVLPAVQLPSMTPEITDTIGQPVTLSMRALAELPDTGTGGAWDSLDNLAEQYELWIQNRKAEAAQLYQASSYQQVAVRHLQACENCLCRIRRGIALLRQDQNMRRAFRLANLAMLLQQITTKKLERRPLRWDQAAGKVSPMDAAFSCWEKYTDNDYDGVGLWRAFQIAFILMSLEGAADGGSSDRDVVDLIWFPTGGGKTEAYLGVAAFYMLAERLQATGEINEVKRDGTNVLMRYTLRMLTTQQFQRAASLICAMEFLRRHPEAHGVCEIPGRKFSLGLWVGRDGSPNSVQQAKEEVRNFKNDKRSGSPLVITECPWCRAEIGRLDQDNPLPKKKKGSKLGWTDDEWHEQRTKGIRPNGLGDPLLFCPDISCEFGKSPDPETWLPVEVIDERIYKNPPSLVIATADKLAMVAYRPEAGILFGRASDNGTIKQINRPPGLIIQDELHLISGPLGTMYALYEGIFERLCSYQTEEAWIKPKLIASTATIRGAAEQVKSLYDRSEVQLFPCPGLNMGDSFFGRYSRKADETLSDGRLYLGIHATNYGSVLTTQIRAFSAALFRPFSMPSNKRDPWWTLLAFYNSIRELGGARTLFDSDIKSRLKAIFNREGFPYNNRRNVPRVEELTSRRSQPEIVHMMDRLALRYKDGDLNQALDVCLASNIIEVGVDIDRLSLMGVVGQPKTTASYIQVTGRIGRKWQEKPGLVLMIYNPGKSRDRSHFEQFHSYHRRLYERVEPTSVTPFAISALHRGLVGALITHARQQLSPSDPVSPWETYEEHIRAAFELLLKRCKSTQAVQEDVERSSAAMTLILEELICKWRKNPSLWQEYPQNPAGHYLMLWPGQYATTLQSSLGVHVPSSMRQVDGSGELRIVRKYGEMLNQMNA